jgi:hypothetical protein
MAAAAASMVAACCLAMACNAATPPAAAAAMHVIGSKGFMDLYTARTLSVHRYSGTGQQPRL